MSAVINETSFFTLMPYFLSSFISYFFSHPSSPPTSFTKQKISTHKEKKTFWISDKVKSQGQIVLV